MKKACIWLAGIVVLSGAFFDPGAAVSGEADFRRISEHFISFLTCELTRVDAPVYFEGKPFKITSITVTDTVTEGDLQIVTGVVKCWVEKRYHVLYAAVGVKKVAGFDRVAYLTVRQSDFEILASELAGYPYRDRCDWSRYRVNPE